MGMFAGLGGMDYVEERVMVLISFHSARVDCYWALGMCLRFSVWKWRLWFGYLKGSCVWLF